jgi:hypothetical protein
MFTAAAPDGTAKNLLGHSSIVLTSNPYGHVFALWRRAMAGRMCAVLRT